jgi:RND superfamily putative drug exporter
MSTYLYGLASRCYRNRRRVLVAWLLVAVGVISLGVLSGGKESEEITIPGTESENVVSLLEQKVPAFSGAQTQVVFVSREGSSVTSASSASGIQAAVRQMDGVSQVASVTNPVQTKTISSDHRAAIATVLWKVKASSVEDSSLSSLQRAVRPATGAGLNVQFGGQVFPDWNPKVGEIPELVGITIAFVILLVVFGSLVAAGLPIVSAIIGVAITASGITALAAVTDVTTVAITVALMLGLSTGIDYGLFILSRHRSQLLTGRPMGESVATAVGTAGSSVVFAGGVVIVALLGLIVVGIPFISTVGLVAAGAVVISVLVAVTLVPAILGLAGVRVSRFVRDPVKPGRPEQVARVGATQPHRTAGAAWGRFVVRHRIPVLIAGIGLAAVIAFPITSLRLGLPTGAWYPDSSTGRQAYDLTTEHFGPGFNGPLLAVTTPATPQQSLAITERITKVPGVLTAAPAALQNNTAVIQVIPTTGPNASDTTNLVNRIRDERQQLAGNGARLLVGGNTASNIDVSDKLSSALPIFLVTIVVLALILLTLAFRTVLVPIKSILGFLLSIAAALGATVAVFQWGWGADLLGVTKSSVTLSYLPIILLAIIFGLSSDYEVFVVSRIKERFTKTGDARQAVTEGTGVSVRVVTAAALIMFSVFMAFLSVDNVIVKPIAFSFAVGVLVDAFLVRLTLVPAVMAIAGGRMWHHPKWFAEHVPDPDIEGERLEEQLAASDNRQPGVEATSGR